jgi:hypothetical protein
MMKKALILLSSIAFACIGEKSWCQLSIGLQGSVLTAASRDLVHNNTYKTGLLGVGAQVKKKIDERIAIGGILRSWQENINISYVSQTPSYIRISDRTTSLSGMFEYFFGNRISPFIGADAGIYFKASEKWSFAATYKSKIQMNIDEGNAVFVVPSSVASSFPNGKFTSSLPLPAVTTIGASFKLNHRLTFASDINYIEWKAYDSLIFDYETNTTSLLDTKSARGYKNTFAFRLGSQYQLNKKLKLRAGIVFGLTPVPYGRVTPETPDNNRINYSVGFGYSFTEKFKIDASVLYTTFKREDTNLETLLSGTFKTIAIAPGLSLTYLF